MKRITQGLMILLSFVAITLSAPIMAADLKIGIVDLHRVLKESPLAYFDLSMHYIQNYTIQN